MFWAEGAKNTLCAIQSMTIIAQTKMYLICYMVLKENICLTK